MRTVPQQSVLPCNLLFSPAWSPQSLSPVSSKQPENDATHCKGIAFWIKANCCSVPLCSPRCSWCLQRPWPPAQLLQRAVPCVVWTQEGCLLLLAHPQFMNKCWHKWVLLQPAKFWKDWLNLLLLRNCLFICILLGIQLCSPRFEGGLKQATST